MPKWLVRLSKLAFAMQSLALCISNFGLHLKRIIRLDTLDNLSAWETARFEVRISSRTTQKLHRGGKVKMRALLHWQPPPAWLRRCIKMTQRFNANCNCTRGTSCTGSWDEILLTPVC